MEHRRQPRITVDKLKITGKMIFANTVDIIDISAGGISFTADRRMNIGGEYTLKIEEADKRFAMKGTVIWSLLHGNRKTDAGDFVPIYVVGMKFANMASEKVSELIRFIEAHKQQDAGYIKAHDLSGLRFNMRFHISVDGKTLLECPESYTVRKISMAGMLVTSRVPLAVDERLPMEFSVPGNSPVSFIGRVASCLSPGGPDSGYEIGIEFNNMPEGHSQKLREFINRLNQSV